MNKKVKSKGLIKKSILIGLICIAVISVWFIKAKTTQSADAEVEKEYTVSNGDIKITFYGDGEAVLPITNADFTISGEVEEIFVEEGQQVKQGDILAKLDDTDYEKTLQIKEISYQESKLNYDIAIGDDVENTKQQLDTAVRDYENEKINYELKVEELNENIEDLEYEANKLLSEYNLMLDTKNQYSTAELEDKKKAYEDTLEELNDTKKNYDYNVGLYKDALLDAQAKYEELKKEYDQLTSGESPNLKMKEIDLINAEIALQNAQEDLVNTELKSPIDGTVLYISKNIGEEVVTSGFKTDEAIASTDHFIVIQNNENPRIETVISEVDLVSIYKEQEVDIIFESIEDIVFKGTVVGISSLPTIDNNGIVTYDVTIELVSSEELDEYGQQIKNGMTCSLDFIIKQVEDVIQIPVDAVYVESGKQYVDIKSDNGIEKRQIKTGLTDGRYVEVTEGLNSKEVIVY